MINKKYYVITNLGSYDGCTLDVFDEKKQLEDFLKGRGKVDDLTIIEGHRLFPEYKFYYSLNKEESK